MNNKKLAVIKIGARICFGKVNKNGEYKNPRDTSGGNGEARAIIEMLHRGGADITIMTNVADDDYKPEQYKFVNIIDLYKYSPVGAIITFTSHSPTAIAKKMNNSNILKYLFVFSFFNSSLI